uniref:DUF637 domain-containing protein n=1 Tax=Parastrongyloides trichosuri TaxID=131310 RepID=A0A0N5A100_PARTI
MATGFKFAGDQTIRFENGSLPKIVVHAVMGGLLAEATGSDFKTGAMAAGLNEAMADTLSTLSGGDTNVHVMLSQLTGVLAAAAVNGDLQKGSEVAQSATIYNHDLHRKNAESFAKGIADACRQMPGYCAPGAENVTEQQMVQALEATARHAGGDVAKRGKNATKAAKGTVPSGFANTKEFSSFGGSVRDGLSKAGYGNVEPILQGSAVTGKSYRTGQAFDVGRTSDFDIALASPELLRKAESLGIGLRSGGARTGPLSMRDLKALGLNDLASQLTKQAGRDVNFMIYGSTSSATSRAPSLILPK